AISVRETGVVRKGRAVGYATAAIAACAALPQSWTALQLSEYKGLSQTLLVPGVKVLAEEAGVYGLLTVVSSSAIPFRYAPGLSLSNSMEPPAQLAFFPEGAGLPVIRVLEGGLEPLAYLDHTLAALPYHLLEKPEVLILGVAGGADVLLALLHRAPRIDAVELNPQLVRLVSK